MVWPLRIAALVTVVSPTLKEALLERDARFLEENGYHAPYWTLVDFAQGVFRTLALSERFEHLLNIVRAVFSIQIIDRDMGLRVGQLKLFCKERN